MKRKYVALMLGLTLAFSSIAYAEENTQAAAKEAAGEMELSEEEDALYGEITEIGEDSITVALGTMGVDEEMNAQETEGADTEEDTAKAEDANTETDAGAIDTGTSASEENADAVEEVPEMEENGAPEGQPMNGGRGMKLELTGEEQTITITEDTLFYQEFPMQDSEDEMSEELAEEGAEGTNSEISSQEDATVNEEADSVEATAEEADEVTVELEEISFEDLAEGDVLKITLDEAGNAETVTVVMQEPEENGDEVTLEEVPAEEAEVMTLEEVDTEAAITE